MTDGERAIVEAIDKLKDEVGCAALFIGAVVGFAVLFAAVVAR